MTKHKDMLVPIATQALAQILRAISPPNTLVHVGWGNGLGELVQWTQWQVPHAYVIEAEESKAAACEAQALALAQTWTQAHNPWQTICATLSAQNAEQIYHLASNPSESGLLPPESLQHAWPHLQTVATQTVATRSLDKLWQDLSPPLPRAQVKSHTWLIIDCLPAADILSGGATALQSAQVVCARSLLADRAKLCDQMRTAGWLEVGWAESHHPAFGHAWFIRDTALELGNAARHRAQLVTERDALAQAKEVETAAKTQALAERDALAQAKGQLQSQLEALKKAIAESQAQLGITNQAQTDLKSQLSAITQAQAGLKIELEEANKRHATLVAERDSLAQAKESEIAAKNQALTDRDALVKAKQIETAAKTQALAERDALAQAKGQLQSQLEALKKAIAESQAQLGITSQAQTDLQSQLSAITQAQAGLQKELDEANKRHATLVAERDSLAQAKESEIAAKNQALTDRDALVKAKQIETAAKTQALAERDALAQANEQLQSHVEAFKKAIAAQLGVTNQAQSDLQGQLSAISQAQEGLQKELDEANKRQGLLVAERDTLVKAKEAETAAKNHAFIDRDSMTAAKNQALSERDALAKAIEDQTAILCKAKTEKDALTKEKQTLEAMLNESQELLQQLQSANQDLQNRQHLQHEDLVKAEAQIELIKDLLLREQGI